jgi:hypothetical protein
MKKQLPLLVIIFLCLGAYALYAAQKAFHRGELMLFIVLLFIAVIFWNRSQKSS